MTYSLFIDVGDGATTDFSVPAHIDRSHITVKVNGVVKTLGSDFTYFATNTIRFSAAPSDGSVVTAERATSRGTALVTWQGGAEVTQANLDRDSRQAFYMAQEAFDAATNGLTFDPTTGKLDAGNKSITNLANPVGASDAATKSYIDAIAALFGVTSASSTVSTWTVNNLLLDDGLGHDIWSFERSGDNTRIKLRDRTSGIDSAYFYPSGAIVMPGEVQVGNEENRGFLRFGWDGLVGTPVIAFGNHEDSGWYWNATYAGPVTAVGGHNRMAWAGDGALHLAIADNGNAAVKVVNTVNQVNRLELSGAVTANAVKIAAAGSDANIDLQLAPKGTGKLVLPQNTNASVQANGNDFGNYLTVKAADGTLLYIPCKIAPW